MTVRSTIASNLGVTEPTLIAMIVDSKDGKEVYADRAVGEPMIKYMGDQDGGLDLITTKPWPARAPRGVELSLKRGVRTVQSARAFGQEDGVVFYVKMW